jgi:hypothetical protein
VNAEDRAREVDETVRRRLAAADGHRKIWAAVGVTLVGVALLAVAYFSQRGTARERDAEQDQTITSLSALADDNARAAVELAEQVRGLGGVPVVQPPTPGERGRDGRPPTAEEIGQAVAAYCADGRCNGDDVTPEQVAAAVATYCNSRGECRGTPGADGDDGETGQQGPPPSAEQVADAVAAYCADGRCRGEQGERGEKGDQGEPGEPGPACPPGYEPRESIETLPDGSTAPGVACVRTGAPPTTTTTTESGPPLLPVGRR